MKLYTFNYAHNFSHGGAVVLATTYKQAIDIINEFNKDVKYPPLIFKTHEEYDNTSVSWEYPVLIFEKEIETDNPKIVYEYEDIC